MPAYNLSQDTAYDARLRRLLMEIDNKSDLAREPESLYYGSRPRNYVVNGSSATYPSLELLMANGDLSPNYKKERANQIKGGRMSGGVNHHKKAKMWLDFSSDALNRGLDAAARGVGIYQSAKGGRMSGGINRHKKAKKWLDFSTDALNRGLDATAKGVGIYQSAKGGARSGGRIRGCGLKSMFEKVKSHYDKIPAPIRKEIEKKALEEAHKLIGSGTLTEVKHHIKHKFHELAEPIKEKLKDLALKHAHIMVKAHGGSFASFIGKVRHEYEKVPAPMRKEFESRALTEGKKLIGGKKLKHTKSVGKHDGRAKRAEIVRKVMHEHGMKMIDASKYVKEHGLY